MNYSFNKYILCLRIICHIMTFIIILMQNNQNYILIENNNILGIRYIAIKVLNRLIYDYLISLTSVCVCFSKFTILLSSLKSLF
jgi:hypothetical protein